MLKKKRIIGTKILVIIAVIVVLILGLVKIVFTQDSEVNSEYLRKDY